ncbi:MAG: enoyl-CoA hydratase-related protein [Phycisphaerales bacterium]|jgi:enoyl-CoA hydratase/carnithine racemase
MTTPLPVHTDDRGTPVLVVELTQDAPVVVLDRALLEALDATLAGLSLDGVAGVVLASASEKVFVAGADLKAVRDLSDADLHAYLEFGASVFAKFHQMPVWTAAAINGAALGGGLELAMHCDGLIGAPGQKPYPVGLPEAGLGICPGWGGTNLLPARIDPATAIRATAAGTPMPYPDAADAGLFDLIAQDATPPSSGLRSLAADWIRGQGAPPTRDGAPYRWIGREAGPVREALKAVEADLPDTGPGAGPAKAVAEAVAVGLGTPKDDPALNPGETGGPGGSAAGGWQEALQTERHHLVRLRHEPAGRAAIEKFFSKSK